ncbi:MAG: conjugal transfer protein TraA, partial [Sphingobium sp. 32-64-5]
ALARAFVQREFVDRGMIADLNVHWDIGADGESKPHAHVMLTLRSVSADGFGLKVRDWNDTALLRDWREAWANHVNLELARLDLDLSIDHRSFKDQGLALEPQQKIGPAGMRRDLAGEAADRAKDHRDLARRNGDAIIANPALALEAITYQQSTFTDHDLMRFIHRHSDDKDQFEQALGAVRASPEVVALGKDRAGRERFSSRAMLETEQRLEADANVLGARRGHGVSAWEIAAAGRAGAGGLALSEGQQRALEHVTAAEDLALVVGFAGSGKSTMLAAARYAWEAQGYQVRGAALSGIAAEGLEGGSGIASRTIASLEYAWARDRDGLTDRDVLVIDEAGMIGSRQMQRVIEKVREAGAKLVLVGDAEQLQAIEAGAAFRALTERHGAAEIGQIQRQIEDWQRDATRELATGATRQALQRYENAGRIDVQATREEAAKALVATWARDRTTAQGASQIILTHRRADVAQLNSMAREALRDQGALGEDQNVQLERGER